MISSVTRFGEISPHYKILKLFGYIFEGVLSIWQNFEPNLAKCLLLGKYSFVVNCQILIKNLANLVTLIWSAVSPSFNPDVRIEARVVLVVHPTKFIRVEAVDHSLEEKSNSQLS